MFQNVKNFILYNMELFHSIFLFFKTHLFNNFVKGAESICKSHVQLQAICNTYYLNSKSGSGLTSW